jgi:hypothetical protein
MCSARWPEWIHASETYGVNLSVVKKAREKPSQRQSCHFS